MAHASGHTLSGAGPTPDAQPSRVFITSGARGVGRDIALSYARYGARFIGVGDPNEDFGALAHDIIDAATPQGQDVDPKTAPQVVLVKLDLAGDDSEDDARRSEKFLRIGLGAEVPLDVIVHVDSDSHCNVQRDAGLIEQYLVPLLGDGTDNESLRTLVNISIVGKGDQDSQTMKEALSFQSSASGGLLVYTVVITETLLRDTSASESLGDAVFWLTQKRRESFMGKVVNGEELIKEYVGAKQG